MLTRLTLTNFRNHETLRLETDRHVVLVGKNGVGKTNVLEAVSLLNGTGGLRHAESSEIAKFRSNDYAVAATIGGNDVAVYWNGSGHRRAKINGESAPLSDLAKTTGIVWLTPAEDLIFAGSPAGRRSFLDNLIAGLDPSHLGRTARLSKLMTERAFALKNYTDDNWLSAIENNLSLTAAAIADARVKYTANLNHFLEAGEIGLSGMIEQKIITGEKCADIEEEYRKYLANSRFLIADKQAIDGPNRSDFSILNRELGLPADKTSSGQQKLMLNRIVIANARLINARHPNRTLLILLDEVDSHLDATARKILFDELDAPNVQIWMTGTDRAALSSLHHSICVNL